MISNIQIKYGPGRTNPNRKNWRLIFYFGEERREIVLRYKNIPLAEDTPDNRKKAETIAEEYLDRWHPEWHK